MITAELTAFIVCVFVGIVLMIVINKERRLGRRFFAAKLRNWLDSKVVSCSIFFSRSWQHFSKYVVQLSWYYSIHSVLRTFLRLMVVFYTYFENIFERNRERTKQLRSEKRQLSEFNHLHQINAHKQDTALSAVEKRKLKRKKLEEKH